MDNEKENYITMLENASPFKKKMNESIKDDMKNDREYHTALGNVVRNWDGEGELPTESKSKELESIKKKILGQKVNEPLEENSDEEISPMEKLDEDVEDLDESQLEEIDDPESEVLKRLIQEMENIVSEMEDDECPECGDDEDDEDYLDDEESSDYDDEDDDFDDDEDEDDDFDDDEDDL